MMPVRASNIRTPNSYLKDLNRNTKRHHQIADVGLHSPSEPTFLLILDSLGTSDLDPGFPTLLRPTPLPQPCLQHPCESLDRTQKVMSVQFGSMEYVENGAYAFTFNINHVPTYPLLTCEGSLSASSFPAAHIPPNTLYFQKSATPSNCNLSLLHQGYCLCGRRSSPSQSSWDDYS